MWYKYAAYSTELGKLKNHLKGHINVYDFAPLVPEYIKDTIHSEDLNDIFNNNDCINWLGDHTAEHDSFKGFIEYYKKEPFGNYDNLPPYAEMNFEKILAPTWLVHFTDNANMIKNKGFIYGHPEMAGLAVTTWKDNRHEKSGFNFAFIADGEDAIKESNFSNYGSQAVIFYAGGIITYHTADQEQQILFWGPNVNKDMIFPIMKNKDKWQIIDHKTGKEIVGNKSFSEIVDYVKTNWRMLQKIL